MAAPYALSSDLVSAWPAKSLEVAQYIDGQVPLLAMTQNAQTGTTYTFVAADFTKLVTLSNASPVTVTLPLEATVPWPAYTQLRLLNQGAGLVTVAGAVGVTINGTPLTLAQYKGAILTKTGTNIWTFLPFSGGSAPAVISSTTGSPTITTNAGATVYEFNGDGTIVVGTAGVVRLLVIGAGGGGANDSGGGAGGFVTDAAYELAAGTYNIKIGAGSFGAGGIGGHSFIGPVLAMGGGGGQATTGNGVAGASGGGAGRSSTGGAAIYGSQGFAGGNASGSSVGQGGGGAGSAGATATGGGGTGLGGAGIQSDIVVSGTQVYYSGGGNGDATTTPAGQTARATDGTANRGGGAGGFGTQKTGGSGKVVVRVG